MRTSATMTTYQTASTAECTRVNAWPVLLVVSLRRSVSNVVYQKIGMVTTHTTMQYGHRAWMSYRLARISQCTNTTPKVTPTCMPMRNQVGGSNPASMTTPAVTTTANATRPSSG